MDAENEGYLVVVYMDKSSKTDPDSHSVSEIISDLRKNIEQNPGALLLFEQKLDSAGYADSSAYDDIYFRLSSIDYYLVSNDIWN